MISHNGQTELVLPLFEGLLDTPLWETFLQRLMARTQAQRVRLTITSATESGRPILQRRVVMRRFGSPIDAGDEDAALTVLTSETLRANRVYGLGELCENSSLPSQTGTETLLQNARIGDARLIRISAAPQHSVWITLLHDREAFQAADSALLAALAPAIRVAVQNLFTIEAFKTRMEIAEASLARLGIGQAVLDDHGRTIAADPMWQRQQPLIQDRAGQIAAACAELQGSADGECVIVPGGKLDQPLLLRRHIERGGPLSRSAVAVVSYRIPAGPDISSIEPVIAATFGLSPREAALAAKLAMGHSLADAGNLLGLTIETTRNYSKRIFAKTGSHGQTDLVRRILACLP